MLDGLGRLGSFVATALLFGLAPVLLLVLRPSSSRSGDSSARMGAALETVVRMALVLGVAGTVAILLHHASLIAEFRGEEMSVSALTAAFDSSFGRWYGIRLPILAALSVLLVGRVKLSMSTSPGAGWWVAWMVLAGALMVTTSFAGHAAARSSVAIANDAVHLVAGAVWFTGVAGLTILAFSVTRLPGDSSFIGGSVIRFSRLALVSVAVIAITGALNSILQLSRPGDLLDSAYGRVLSVKLGLFAVVLGLGAVNHWRVAARFRRAHDPAPTTRLFRRTITIELVTAVAIMSATAILVAAEPTRQTASGRVGLSSTLGPGIEYVGTIQ